MARAFLLYLFTAAVLVHADDVDRFRYDPFAEKVYEGTVGSKLHTIDGLMYFAIKTSDKTLEVQIGPEEFVKRSGFKVRIGEMVTVVGMPLAWDSRDIVLARQVSTMMSLLIVRDRNGHPMWDMYIPVLMDPEISARHLCKMIEPSTSINARSYFTEPKQSGLFSAEARPGDP